MTPLFYISHRSRTGDTLPAVESDEASFSVTSAAKYYENSPAGEAGLKVEVPLTGVPHALCAYTDAKLHILLHVKISCI